MDSTRHSEGLSPFTTAPQSGSQTPYEVDPLTEPIHFTPKGMRRAMASFENLVALANSQERLRYVMTHRRETLKEARKMIWRDRGQPVVELDDIRECLRWAATGGLRAAMLPGSIRACFNLVLALINVKVRNVPRKHWFTIIKRAIFGLDTWRFAAMLGTFVSVYKLLLNALPIYLPSIRPQREDDTFYDDDEEALPTTSFDVSIPPTPGGALTPGGPLASNIRFTPGRAPIHLTIPRPSRNRSQRLSLSTQAQRILVRKKTKRWHAASAGAIAGGLAIMWEAKSRRVGIAQQLFVRGLQGSWNSYTTKRGASIPHGDVLVFSLVCGQILYAFLLRQDTLPKSYNQWVSNASKVPPPAIRLNNSMVRTQTFNPADIDDVLRLPTLTPLNASRLLALKAGETPITPYGPCAAIHPAESSCLEVPVTRFFDVFKWMLPVYGALHFIPPILFKRSLFKRDGKEIGKVLVRSAAGTMRSSAFLGVFVIIYQSINCYNHYLHSLLTSSKKIPIPRWLIDFLFASKFSFWMPGFLSGLSLFIEEKRRRPELAMYVLPKGLESAWLVLTGKTGLRGGKKGKRVGEMMLAAVGMGMVMGTYQNEPQHLGGLVRRILYQFIGPN